MNIKEVQLNNRLKEVREALGLSRNKLAEQFHISTPHLANMENGKRNINIELVCGLYTAYRISSEYLLFGTGDMYVKEEKRKRLNISKLSDAERMDIFLQLYHYVEGYKIVTVNGKPVDLMEYIKTTDGEIMSECIKIFDKE